MGNDDLNPKFRIKQKSYHDTIIINNQKRHDTIERIQSTQSLNKILASSRSNKLHTYSTNIYITITIIYVPANIT